MAMAEMIPLHADEHRLPAETKAHARDWTLLLVVLGLFIGAFFGLLLI